MFVRHCSMRNATFATYLHARIKTEPCVAFRHASAVSWVSMVTPIRVEVAWIGRALKNDMHKSMKSNKPTNTLRQTLSSKNTSNCGQIASRVSFLAESLSSHYFWLEGPSQLFRFTVSLCVLVNSRWFPLLHGMCNSGSQWWKFYSQNKSSDGQSVGIYSSEMS